MRQNDLTKQISLIVGFILLFCAGIYYLLISFNLPGALLFVGGFPILWAAYRLPRWGSLVMFAGWTGFTLWYFYSQVPGLVELAVSGIVIAVVGFALFLIQRISSHRDSLEKRWQVVVGKANTFDFWRNADGSFGALSPACEQITGYSVDDFTQKPELLEQIIHAEDRNKVTAAWGKEDKKIEFRLNHRDGRECWIEQEFKRVYAENGAYLGIRASNRDVTIEKKALDALKKSSERMALALEGMEGGIWDADLTTGLTFFSPSYAKTLGLDVNSLGAETRLRNLQALIHPTDLPAVLDAFREHLQAETPVFQAEYRIRTRQDEWRWVLDQGKVFWRSPKGKALRMIGTHVDITNRKRIEEALLQSEQKFRQLAENMREVFWLRDRASGRFIYVSPAYREVWGRSVESLYRDLGSYTESIHWEDYKRIYPAQKELYDDAKVFNEELRIIHPDGTMRWVWVREYPIQDSSGKYYRTAGIAEDVTERKRTEADLIESEKRYRDLIEHQGGGVSIVSPTGIIVYANPAGEDIYGVDKGTLAGRSLGEFLDKDRFEFIQSQSALRQQGVESSYEMSITRPDLQKRNLLVTSTPRFDANGQFLGTIEIFRDNTQRKKREDKLRYASAHDSLTGLYNRAYFEERISQMEQSSSLYPVSVLMIDVDDLKLANDQHGHSAGDELLVMAAEVLKSSIRSGDVVARIGGDEFFILLPSSDQAALRHAMERIAENVATVNKASKQPFVLGLSVGGYVCKKPGGLRHALDEADARMYQDKTSKKQYFVVLDDGED